MYMLNEYTATVNYQIGTFKIKDISLHLRFKMYYFDKIYMN